MRAAARPLRVCIVAIPDAVISTLSGLYDVLGCLAMIAGTDDALPARPPFLVEIVGESRAPLALASGLPVQPQRAVADIADADIVIVPSVVVGAQGWQAGRYPGLVEWAAAMHARGATLCSARSEIFLLAETGLFDGRDATVHWGYAAHLERAFPAIRAAPERALVAARFFALQWHRDGLAPYIVFRPPTDHGDAAVAQVQDWIATHYAVGSPVDEMVRRSGLAERSFKRRFGSATGLSPISYVQRLRVEEAKRWLERTEAPVDEIAWRVGYEEPAFFRRLFRRLTGVSPGAYRRGFRVPAFDP